MVQIKIKGLNNAYHVVATFDDFDAFLYQLEEKLRACAGMESRGFEAFFHLSNMVDNELIIFFKLCEKCRTIVKGINYIPYQSKTVFMEQDLRGGHTYQFQDIVVLIGNIREQAFVTCKESLYVIGNVQGSVDFLHDDCILCSSYLEGNVRICDSHFQNMTSFLPCKVYYDNRQLKMKEFKEERMWERQ